MNEMDLAEIGLGRIARDARAMLHRHAAMRVALDAETGEEADAFLGRLREEMRRASVDGDDNCRHCLTGLRRRVEIR